MQCKKCKVEIETERIKTKSFYEARFCAKCWEKEKKVLEDYSKTLSNFFSKL